MPKQNIVPAEEAARYLRFKELEAVAEDKSILIMSSVISYWQALYEIHVEHLWDAGGMYNSEDAWLEDNKKLTLFGPARSTFYQTIKAIDAMTQNGASLDTVFFFIGKSKTAATYDMPNRLMVKEGKKYRLLPSVQKHLDETGQTFEEAVMDLAQMTATDARAQISMLQGSRRVFAADSAWDGLRLLVTLVETGGDDATVTYNATVTFKQKPSDRVRQWIETKF